MRIQLSIDSATGGETWDFVCAFQRTAGMPGPVTLTSEPTVRIAGSYFGVTTPHITIERANAMLREFNALTAERAERPRPTERAIHAN